MNKFKECRVVMLPTKEKSLMFIDEHGGDIICYSPEYFKSSIEWKDVSHQHLYITSDEEIKKRDWCYSEKAKNFYREPDPAFANASNYIWKIIATTNPELGKYIDGSNPLVGEFIGVQLPQIPQSFILHYISEYNKGNKIEKVEVEYEDRTDFFDVKDAIDGPAWKLFINPDNTINIKPIKDSWTREEVKELTIDAMITGVNIRDRKLEFNIERDKWVKENL